MKLKESIEQIIEASGAQVGLALRHLETGEELLLDADAYYVLASTFKVPVLVEAFFQISAGRLSLAERLPLRTADKNLPSGVLTFFEDGLLPTESLSPEGRFTYAYYNANNQQTASVDGRGNTTSYKYDADGLLTATVSPAGTDPVVIDIKVPNTRR